MPIEFGTLVPCRYCKGAGERVAKMTPEEQRERNRELRRAKKGDWDVHTLDRVSPLKTCPDCRGEGYVPPSHNMFR